MSHKKVPIHMFDIGATIRSVMCCLSIQGTCDRVDKLFNAYSHLLLQVYAYDPYDSHCAGKMRGFAQVRSPDIDPNIPWPYHTDSQKCALEFLEVLVLTLHTT